MTTAASTRHTSTLPVRPAEVDRYRTTALPVRRFTVEEYHRLIDQGFFASDERFELLEGWIVAKMPRNPIHDAAVQIAEEVIRLRLPSGWRIRTQSALTTLDSEPEPDLVVCRGHVRSFIEHHPGPGDVALVIEVANTTLQEDREVKGRLYARAGVLLYWIINLVDRRVEIYTEPSGAGPTPSYRRREEFGVGQTVSLAIGGIELGPIPVAELLP